MKLNKFKAARQKQRLNEYKYTDACVTCGKGLMDRDSEYSNYKFGASYCFEHAPKQTKEGKEFIKPAQPNNNTEQKEFLANNQLEDIPF